MKDLLSKDHYCSEIHTLGIKKRTYPPHPSPHSPKPPPIWIPPQFLKENLDPPSRIFQKSQPLSHTEKRLSIKKIICIGQ